MEVQRRMSELNRAYGATFRSGKLSLGLVVPVEAYSGPAPTMQQHLQRVQLAEALGFSALWLRDVPFNVPSFGDAGQLFDPFVYLGYLAAHTERIALGVASVILPLRHPAHVAKAAASVDVLSGGRLLLGVASGDRPEEYPALDVDFDKRAESFRASYEYIRRVSEACPQFENAWGSLSGAIDLLPKPEAGRLPLLLTGGSQQSPEWVAAHGEGWMTYPRAVPVQERIVSEYRRRVAEAGLAEKPVIQSLYVDLTADAGTAPRPIHLGYRLGAKHLRSHLKALEEIGINHVAINLRFNQEDMSTTLHRLADELLGDFSGDPS